jgi:anti-sigma regulatory factor (Ser/Thr protein kinase)
VEMNAGQRLAYESGISIPIDDSSQIGEARRTASSVATAAGLSEVEAGKFAIIGAEAATNISKHATRGEILLRSAGETVRAVDLIAIDAGPGIRDLEKAFRDGYSTAGSSGAGLGAMARLASAFDVFSAPGVGTVIAARVSGSPIGAPRKATFEVGVARAAKRGERDCGDDWSLAIDDQRGRGVLTLADGLGHGMAAAEASRRAVELAEEHAADPPGHLVLALHRGLRSTRGAAVAVAEFWAREPTLRYAGLGNISAAIVGPHGSKSLVSHNGIAGHEMRKVQEYSYDWPVDALLVMHSDGVSARWDLSRYPGLLLRHPNVVAGVIYRDFSRGRDDALVVVVRRVT